ncbi:MAG TPA: BMC domain-containing protein [Anaerolineales bacterium]|nr:BMC domain-containing protein [Anaerolineales bacterium]
MKKALGLIETIGLVTAIEAADAAVKSANVTLVGYENTRGGGKITVKVVGDVGAVQAAVAAGVAAAERIGKVYGQRIIPKSRPLSRRWFEARSLRLLRLQLLRPHLLRPHLLSPNRSRHQRLNLCQPLRQSSNPSQRLRRPKRLPAASQRRRPQSRRRPNRRSRPPIRPGARASRGAGSAAERR